MTVHFSSRFLKALKELSNAERAVADRAYHKSSRHHWGVTAPLKSAALKELAALHDRAELLQLAKDLWATDIFDAMIAAASILGLLKVTPGKDLWKVILSFMKDVDGWALEDTLARAAWKCIADDETRLDDLERWTQHKNFWYRRASLVFTLPYAKKGKDPERMLQWASSYADDPEWFIQKAIGWWLRDLGAYNPDRVIEFLQEHWPQLKYVARHEATRKLPEKYVRRLGSQAVR